MYQITGYTRPAANAYGSKQNRQSPALTQPLPDFKPPVGARGQDIMIIWDMQNVRIPIELEPVDVIRFLYITFVTKPGPRRCAGAFCTFTDNTKKAVGERRFNQFCSNGVLNFMMINSPGGPRKADDSDHPLKEMMMNFTVDRVRGHKDGVLLLVTGDADFVRPAIWCKQQGCVSLELLYYDPIASHEIRTLEAGWKMEWRDFLDCCVGRRCPWTFPYPQDIAAGLVPNPNIGSSSSNNYYGSSGYTGRSSLDRQQQQRQDHHQQQQQHTTIAGFLPAPQRRLLLPDPARPAAAASSSAIQPAAAVGMQLSSANVQLAATQLLHNPAALHQVVQQYKQSMNTTAVLQQVLHGVAQAATANAAMGRSPTATAAARGATPAAAAPAAAAAGLGVALGARSAAVPVPQQQQQQQHRGHISSSAGSTPVKPIQIYNSRPASAAAVPDKPQAAAAGSSSSASLTWQQLEQQQQQNGRPGNGRTSGSGYVGDSAAAAAGFRGKSPPVPQWWDPAVDGSSTSASKALRQQQQQRSSGGAAAVGSSSSKLDQKLEGRFKAEGWAEEENEEGFWDLPDNASSSKAAAAAAAGDQDDRSGLLLRQASSSGSSSSVAAAAAASALPPTPSMGLLKRAGGVGTNPSIDAAAATGSSKGSSRGLAVPAAAASDGPGIRGSSSSNGGDSLAGRQHCSSGQAVLDHLQQQQWQPRRLLTRATSPALLDNQNHHHQQQQNGQELDKHQQHHEAQIALLQRQRMTEPPQQAPAAAAASQEDEQQDQLQEGSGDSDDLQLALLQRKQLAAAAAAAAQKQQQQQAGTADAMRVTSHSSNGSSKADNALLGPLSRQSTAELLAAAKALETAAAVVDGSSSSGVVVLERPPPPSWMVRLPPEEQALEPPIYAELRKRLRKAERCRQQLHQQRERARTRELGWFFAADQHQSEQQQPEQQQQQLQQQAECEQGYLIDEETGEVIMMKPRTAGGSAADRKDSVATAAAAAAACDDGAGLRACTILEADTVTAAAAVVDVASGRVIRSQQHSSATDHPAAALDKPPTAAATAAAVKEDRPEYALGDQSTNLTPAMHCTTSTPRSCDHCDQTHPRSSVATNLGHAAAADQTLDVTEQRQQQWIEGDQPMQEFVSVNLSVGTADGVAGGQQQQQRLIEVEISVESSSDLGEGSDPAAARKQAAAAGSVDQAISALDHSDLALSDAAVADLELLSEVSAAAAADSAEVSQWQQRQQPSQAAGLEGLELDGVPTNSSLNPSRRRCSDPGHSSDLSSSFGAVGLDQHITASPGLHRRVISFGVPAMPVADTGPGKSADFAGSSDSDFLTTLVRRVSVDAGAAAAADVEHDLDLETLEQIAAARSAASADLAAAAATDSDQPSQECSAGSDSPGFLGLENLDLHGQPVNDNAPDISIRSPRQHVTTHQISSALDIHTTLASVGFSTPTLDMPSDLGPNLGVLPVCIPNIDPSGFNSPSRLTEPSGFTTFLTPYDPLGFGRSRGPGFRASSPVTAIEELSNGSSSSSEAGSSRDSSEDEGAVGRMSMERTSSGAYQPLRQQ